MQVVRPTEGGLPQVWHLPHLFPEIGGPGIDSWRSKVELVKGEPNHHDDRPDRRYVDPHS